MQVPVCNACLMSVCDYSALLVCYECDGCVMSVCDYSAWWVCDECDECMWFQWVFNVWGVWCMCDKCVWLQCVMSVWCVNDECVMSVWWVCDDCVMTVWWMCDKYCDYHRVRKELHFSSRHRRLISGECRECRQCGQKQGIKLLSLHIRNNCSPFLFISKFQAFFLVTCMGGRKNNCDYSRKRSWILEKILCKLEENFLDNRFLKLYFESKLILCD